MSEGTAPSAVHLSTHWQSQEGCDQPGNEHVPHKSIIAPFASLEATLIWMIGSGRRVSLTRKETE